MSTSESLLYDPIRRVYVEKTPEESVRQKMILYLTESLGYPLGLLSIEKELCQLPSLMHLEGLPNRRVDLLVFMPARLCGKGAPSHEGGLGMAPLLVMECKAGSSLLEKGKEQVMGYNHYIQAPFIAVVDEKSVCLGSRDFPLEPKDTPARQTEGEYQWIPSLLPYSHLIQMVSS